MAEFLQFVDSLTTENAELKAQLSRSAEQIPEAEVVAEPRSHPGLPGSAS
jgi:hypothetical protein